MVDGKATELDITIDGRDFAIKQSPGVLQSKREGGTTGAAVWECSVRFAEWLGSANHMFFARGILGSQSIVLELGAGISGLVPLALEPRVKQVVATDQQYALKLLRENLDANAKSGVKARKDARVKTSAEVLALDWEKDDFTSTLHSHNMRSPFDAVLACDCVFNYALIEPLVQACVDACKHERGSEEAGASTATPAICLVAQQLRQPDVFQQWLEAFLRVFHVWRVPDSMLTERLKEGSGFVVHVGVLR